MHKILRCDYYRVFVPVKEMIGMENCADDFIYNLLVNKLKVKGIAAIQIQQ